MSSRGDAGGVVCLQRFDDWEMVPPTVNACTGMIRVINHYLQYFMRY